LSRGLGWYQRRQKGHLRLGSIVLSFGEHLQRKPIEQANRSDDK